MGAQPQQNSQSIHQQILALTTSPYGENPIFKDLKIKEGENGNLKATNPAAHKPILDAAIGQFKISSKNVNGVKVKPVGSVLSKVKFNLKQFIQYDQCQFCFCNF